VTLKTAVMFAEYSVLTLNSYSIF